MIRYRSVFTTTNIEDFAMVSRDLKPLYMPKDFLFAPEDGMDYAKEVCVAVFCLTSMIQSA